MKIIDLLNMIAKGEEVPNFWWSGCIHKVEKDINGKYNIFDTYCKKYKNIYLEDLNDEVEIIEEEKEIEELDLKYDIENNDIYNFKRQILMYCDNLQYKINELVREVRKLKEKQ